MNGHDTVTTVNSPFERVIDSLALRSLHFVPRCVTPNQITWANFGVGLLGGFCLYQGTNWLGAYWLAGFLILMHAYLDSLDGSVARARGTASARGKMLDHLLDSLAFSSYALGIAFSSYAQFSIALFIIILVAYHDFLLMMWLSLTSEWNTSYFGAVELQITIALLGIATFFHPEPLLNAYGVDLYFYDVTVLVIGPLSAVDFFFSSRKLYRRLDPAKKT